MKREYFIIFLIALAVIYTAYDLAVALFKKSDSKFIRRKLTFFLFMLVLAFFYMDRQFI